MALLRRLLKYEIHSLRISFISSLIGLIVMIVAISTPAWTRLRYLLKDAANETRSTSIHEHYGIWWYCKSVANLVNGIIVGKVLEICTKSDVLLSDEEFSVKYKAVSESKGPESKDSSQGYFTTRAVFAVVSIFLMILTLIFNAYSIYRPRYTLKRLTAVLYLMSAISTFMSIEMFLEVMGYHEKRLKLSGAIDLEIMYGYSFILNCLVFILYIMGCIIFLAFCSKIKLKDGPQLKEEEKAAEADAPLALY